MKEKLIDHIARSLEKHPDISQWCVRQHREKEFQLFASREAPEEKRTVITQSFSVDLYFVEGKHQGKSSFTILPHEIDGLPGKIESAVNYAKKLPCNRLFFLPPPQRYRKVAACDRSLLADPQMNAEALWHGVTRPFRGKKHEKLATCEIFITSAVSNIRNSRGLAGSFEETRLLLDLVVMAQAGENEAESHSESSMRTPRDFSPEGAVSALTLSAREKLGASLPPSGSFPVVLSREALLTLFTPFIFHASAAAFDKSLSVFRRGKPAWKGGALKGEGLTVISDPHIPLGLKSFPFDRDGTASKKVRIIDKGIFRNIWAPCEHAEYLRMPPTGAFGNTVVAAGETPMESLLAEGSEVLHIKEFSHMEPDVTSGNFTGELRLGSWRSRGKSRAVKGGSVSGNVFEVFSHARFAREPFSMNSYYGPVAIRFESIAVSGA
ncbi:MAG: metallopeptidase TldD-related protein [Candidatus Eremiobacteraeota bacterium]|nr:metallopeptidase TldD-related protein [Candidatus Eremiobacteraeota bacterium]